MKLFYKICIILSLILSIFVARSDIRMAWDSFYNYFEKDIVKSSTVEFNVKEQIQVTKKIDMPGDMRTVDNLIKGSSKISKDNIIAITNKYRKENGNLSLLVENNKLNLLAKNKLQDMFNGQYFEHVSPDGQRVSDLSEQVGYDFTLIGENLALGTFKDDLSIVDGWMASPGHRANILNGHYTEIGVAVGKGVFEGKNVWMSVQHFGTPRYSAVDIINLFF